MQFLFAVIWWFEMHAKCDGLQSSWEHKVIDALVEIIPKSNASYATGQRQVIYALVEAVAKGYALQSTWQRKIIDALVEIIAKRDAPYATGQRNVIHVLIEADVAKCDATNVSDALYIILVDNQNRMK